MVTAPHIAQRRTLDLAHLRSVTPDSIISESTVDSVLVTAGTTSTAESDIDWSHTSFLDTVVRNIAARTASLSDAHLSSCSLHNFTAPTLDAPRVGVEKTTFTACRFGAVKITDSIFHEVEFVGCKIDYLNLRTAKFRDVRFRECVIGEFDGLDSDLLRVNFPQTRIDDFSAHSARLKDVDLRHAALRGITDATGLAGVTMTHDQVLELADVFAAHLGVTVEAE
ncbi:MAG: pentapeptide repeat-containing protein [Bifidobacteriaceae bacterium]|jgi:uncharacterized protein YjbI with pentapeptide repeats|nr:pentapeptide repeat-containing protein [Bifidobacteriaceae bacterium]MCI1914278.1 pentapeptide repeat-containing protein [Bifidobacteriaceae bacterium]